MPSAGFARVKPAPAQTASDSVEKGRRPPRSRKNSSLFTAPKQRQVLGGEVGGEHKRTICCFGFSLGPAAALCGRCSRRRALGRPPPEAFSSLHPWQPGPKPSAPAPAPAALGLSGPTEYKSEAACPRGGEAWRQGLAWSWRAPAGHRQLPRLPPVPVGIPGTPCWPSRRGNRGFATFVLTLGLPLLIPGTH